MNIIIRMSYNIPFTIFNTMIVKIYTKIDNQLIQLTCDPKLK